MSRLVPRFVLAVMVLWFAGGGSVDADPGNGLPACEVTATAAGSRTGFLIFEGYRGVGHGLLSCDTTVAASGITVTVQVTPAGADAGARTCRNSTGCDADADAATARSPANCTFVEASGHGAGALGVPGTGATHCDDITLPTP